MNKLIKKIATATMALTLIADVSLKAQNGTLDIRNTDGEVFENIET